MRYIKKADCYFDTQTGLEWSLENHEPMTWEHAMALGDELGNGWRVPSIQELFSIVDHSKFKPATELPDIVSSYYWSSSSRAYGSDHVWYVYFYNGYVYYNAKTSVKYIRYVRGGPVKYAVEILHRRYIGEDAERKASLQKERVNAEVAQMIYYLRQEADVTQKDLANLIGTTQSVISRLEDADYEGHSLSMLSRIAKALNKQLKVQIKPSEDEQ